MVRSQGISYTRAHEPVKDALRGLTDVSKLSLDSLGAGEATSSANAGIPGTLLKRHGRGRATTLRMAMLKNIFILVYCHTIFRDLNYMYYFTFTPCPAGRGSSIHRAGFFLSFCCNERGEVFSSYGCSLVLPQVLFAYTPM